MPLAINAHFADRDPLTRVVLEQMFAALMLDGIELKGRCCVVALGVSTEA